LARFRLFDNLTDTDAKDFTWLKDAEIALVLRGTL